MLSQQAHSIVLNSLLRKQLALSFIHRLFHRNESSLNEKHHTGILKNTKIKNVNL